MTAPTIVEFLLARLAADEAEALKALASIQANEPGRIDNGWDEGDAGGNTSHTVIVVGRLLAVAEIAIKRTILHQALGIKLIAGIAEQEDLGGGAIIRAMCAVYADHPDYQPEWSRT